MKTWTFYSDCPRDDALRLGTIIAGDLGYQNEVRDLGDDGSLELVVEDGTRIVIHPHSKDKEKKEALTPTTLSHHA